MKVQKHFVVRLGGTDYLDTPNLIVYKGEPILKVTRDENSDELQVEAEIFDSEDIRSTESNYVIRDRSNDRVVCEIRRRAGQQKMDVDVSVLMHMPDGFLIHANPAQSNIRTGREGELVRGRDAAISL
jgi:hypothetical protein